MSKSFFFIGPFSSSSFKRNHRCVSRVHLSSLKKNQKANFRSRDDDDDDDSYYVLVVVARKFQKKARCSLRPVYPPPPRARAPKRCGAKRESRRRTGPASLFSRASLVSSRGIAFCNARKSEETAIYPETCPLRRIRTVLNGKRFRRENERKRELGGNLEKKRAR